MTHASYICHRINEVAGIEMSFAPLDVAIHKRFLMKTRFTRCVMFILLNTKHIFLFQSRSSNTVGLCDDFAYDWNWRIGNIKKNITTILNLKVWVPWSTQGGFQQLITTCKTSALFGLLLTFLKYVWSIFFLWAWNKVLIWFINRFYWFLQVKFSDSFPVMPYF